MLQMMKTLLSWVGYDILWLQKSATVVCSSLLLRRFGSTLSKRTLWRRIQQHVMRLKWSFQYQGSLSVTCYYGKLNGLSIELDQYQSLKITCTIDSSTLAKLVERARIFKFLHGLNFEFDPIQSSLSLSQLKCAVTYKLPQQLKCMCSDIFPLLLCSDWKC